jgi:hypothetical protein
LDIDVPFLFDYNPSIKTPKGDPAMGTTENNKLQILREMVGSLAKACEDADLLDLICKLLMQPGGA